MSDAAYHALTVHLPFASPEAFLEHYGAALAPGGIYLRTTSLHAPGTSVVLDLRLEDGARILFAVAEVAWVTGAHGVGTPGMGLRFIRGDAPTQRFLDALPSGTGSARADGPPLPEGLGEPDARPEALHPPPSQAQPPLPSEASGQLAIGVDGAEVEAPLFEAAAPAPRSGPIIAIDIGGTMARVAVVGPDARPQLQVALPAVVALSSRGRFLAGTSARSQALAKPRWAVSGLNRWMGRTFGSAELDETLRRSAFEIVAEAEGRWSVRLASKTYRIEELYALLLRELKTAAEEQLREPVHRCVVAVPSGFSSAQCDAVCEAGRLAGLWVERTPTAALAAVATRSGERPPAPCVVCCDVGGSSCEVTLLDWKDGAYELIASVSDPFLGGADFDAAIVDWALAEFARLHGCSIDDRVARQRIREAAERAKIELSRQPETRLSVSLVAMAQQQPLDLELTLTRPQLDALTAPLVERITALCHDLLRSRGRSPEQVTEVVLVGGQARAPAVVERLSQLFGRSPVGDTPSEEAVVLGAAVIAQTVATHDGASAADTLTQSIGVGLPGGRFQCVLAHGVALPARKDFVLSTTKDDQASFNLLIFQGEAARAADNNYLGTFTLDELPAGPRGAVSIEVRFELDADRLLTITAREPTSQRQASARFATADTSRAVRARIEALEAMTPLPFRSSPSGGVMGWVRKLWGS